ncbi:hypothetical protein SNEBB_003738 [Seison nebaliae]|nr:hypothetical protein SNEBB_003738 [Seison nebaliae]
MEEDEKPQFDGSELDQYISNYLDKYERYELQELLALHGHHWYITNLSTLVAKTNEEEEMTTRSEQRRSARSTTTNLSSQSEMFGGLRDSAHTPSGIIDGIHGFDNDYLMIMVPVDEMNSLTDNIDAIEFHQILRELTIGIYLFNQTPNISLERNYNDTTSVNLPPCYIDTRIGRILSETLYWFDALWYGCGFKRSDRLKFTERWRTLEYTQMSSEDLLNEFKLAGLKDVTEFDGINEIYHDLITREQGRVPSSIYQKAVKNQTEDEELGTKNPASLEAFIDTTEEEYDIQEKKYLMIYLNSIIPTLTIYNKEAIEQNKNAFICSPLDYDVVSSFKIFDLDLVTYNRLKKRLTNVERCVRKSLRKCPVIKKHLQILNLLSIMTPLLISLKRYEKIPDLTHLLPLLSNEDIKSERQFPPIFGIENLKNTMIDYHRSIQTLQGILNIEVETPVVERCDVYFDFDDASDNVDRLMDSYRHAESFQVRENFPCYQTVYNRKKYFLMKFNVTSMAQYNYSMIWYKKLLNEIVPLKLKKLPMTDINVYDLYKLIVGSKQATKYKNMLLAIKAASEKGLTAVLKSCVKKVPQSKLSKTDEFGLSYTHYSAIFDRPFILTDLLIKSSNGMADKNKIDFSTNCVNIGLKSSPCVSNNFAYFKESTIIDEKLSKMEYRKHSQRITGASSLHLAARCNSLNSMQALLMFGGDSQQHDDRGWLPLHHAAQRDAVPIIRLLLRSAKTEGNFERVNSLTNNSYSSTPLHLAAISGSLEAAKCLLYEFGAKLLLREKKFRYTVEIENSITTSKSFIPTDNEIEDDGRIGMNAIELATISTHANMVMLFLKYENSNQYDRNILCSAVSVQNDDGNDDGNELSIWRMILDLLKTDGLNNNVRSTVQTLLAMTNADGRYWREIISNDGIEILIELVRLSTINEEKHICAIALAIICNLSNNEEVKKYMVHKNYFQFFIRILNIFIVKNEKRKGNWTRTIQKSLREFKGILKNFLKENETDSMDDEESSSSEEDNNDEERRSLKVDDTVLRHVCTLDRITSDICTSLLIIIGDLIQEKHYLSELYEEGIVQIISELFYSSFEDVLVNTCNLITSICNDGDPDELIRRQFKSENLLNIYYPFIKFTPGDVAVLGMSDGAYQFFIDSEIIKFNEKIRKFSLSKAKTMMSGKTVNICILRSEIADCEIIISSLIKFLKLKSELLQAAALGALSSVCIGPHPKNQTRIVEMNSLSTIIHVIKKSSNITVQMRGIKLLKDLAINNPKNQKILSELNCEKIMMKLLEHRANAVWATRIREQCALSLWIVSGRDINQQRRIARHLGLHQIYGMLLSDSCVLQYIGCCAIMSITYQNETIQNLVIVNQKENSFDDNNGHDEIDSIRNEISSPSLAYVVLQEKMKENNNDCSMEMEFQKKIKCGRGLDPVIRLLRAVYQCQLSRYKRQRHNSKSTHLSQYSNMTMDHDDSLDNDATAPSSTINDDKVCLVVIKLVACLCIGLAQTANNIVQSTLIEHDADKLLIGILEKTPSLEIQIESLKTLSNLLQDNSNANADNILLPSEYISKILESSQNFLKENGESVDELINLNSDYEELFRDGKQMTLTSKIPENIRQYNSAIQQLYNERALENIKNIENIDLTLLESGHAVAMYIYNSSQNFKLLKSFIKKNGFYERIFSFFPWYERFIFKNEINNPFFESSAAFQSVILSDLFIDIGKIEVTAMSLIKLVQYLDLDNFGHWLIHPVTLSICTYEGITLGKLRDYIFIQVTNYLAILSHTRSGLTDSIITLESLNPLIELLRNLNGFHYNKLNIINWSSKNKNVQFDFYEKFLLKQNSSINDMLREINKSLDIEVKKYVCIALGLLTFNSTALRTILSIFRREPTLFDLLFHYLPSSPRISKEFIVSYDSYRQLGFPSIDEHSNHLNDRERMKRAQSALPLNRTSIKRLIVNQNLEKKDIITNFLWVREKCNRSRLRILNEREKSRENLYSRSSTSKQSSRSRLTTSSKQTDYIRISTARSHLTKVSFGKK